MAVRGLALIDITAFVTVTTIGFFCILYSDEYLIFWKVRTSLPGWPSFLLHVSRLLIFCSYCRNIQANHRVYSIYVCIALLLFNWGHFSFRHAETFFELSMKQLLMQYLRRLNAATFWAPTRNCPLVIFSRNLNKKICKVTRVLMSRNLIHN